MDNIIETWRINNNVNIEILANIPAASLNDSASSDSRTVAELFAHIHNVRLLWLNVGAPCYSVGLSKIENTEAIETDELKNALHNSSVAVEKMLKDSIDNDGVIEGYKGHLITFFSYMIAHEAHHRGQIAMTLKLAGHPLDNKTAFGIWDWDKEF